MVAIKDASKLKELKELIKGVSVQPEILVGDEGAVEVARHKDAEAVVTGIVGCAGLLPVSKLSLTVRRRLLHFLPRQRPHTHQPHTLPCMCASVFLVVRHAGEQACCC